jgi:hypothetical protein
MLTSVSNHVSVLFGPRGSRNLRLSSFGYKLEQVCDKCLFASPPKEIQLLSHRERGQNQDDLIFTNAGIARRRFVLFSSALLQLQLHHILLHSTYNYLSAVSCVYTPLRRFNSSAVYVDASAKYVSLDCADYCKYAPYLVDISFKACLSALL